jgi:hypothetical protein
MSTEDYNNIPVEFCSKATCCSLDIRSDEEGEPYCHECGGIKISKAHIDIWNEYYIMAHGDKLLNKKRDDTTE